MRRASLLRRQLQWPPLGDIQGMPRNADSPEGESAEEQDQHSFHRRHAEGPRRDQTQGPAPCTACLCRSGRLLVARPDRTVLALCGHWNSAKVAAREGTANRGPSRKNITNPRPGQSSQAAARVPDGKPQSVAIGGRSKEVAALLARLEELTRWEKPIISPLESNPSMTLESPDRAEDTQTADDTSEDSPKTPKKRRRRRRKKTTKGMGIQAALQYQLVLEQEKNQALEKKIREQTTKTDGLTTELTKLLSESKVDLQQDHRDTVLRRFPEETDARTDSGQAEWGLGPLSAHAHGQVQWYDGP